MSNVYGLYIAGNTLVNKGSELYVAKLEDDNKTFSSITLLENNDNSFTGIYSMAVYNATLYIGGIANSYAYLARLDNNTNTFGKNLISNTIQYIFWDLLVELQFTMVKISFMIILHTMVIPLTLFL